MFVARRLTEFSRYEAIIATTLTSDLRLRDVTTLVVSCDFSISGPIEFVSSSITLLPISQPLRHFVPFLYPFSSNF